MKKILFSALVLTALTLTACGGNPSSTETASTAPLAAVPVEYSGRANPLGAQAAASGADLYKVNCASCHGDGGRGDGVAGQSLLPKPVNLVELNKIAGDAYLFWRIYEGKPGTSMVPWRGILTDEQIWQVVAFIRTLK